MPGFGSYVTSDYTKCKNGSYAATITSAKVVTENGVPVLHPDSHKPSAQVVFELDLVGDDGGAIELSRRFGLTYGKNRTTGAYSAWSQLIEAATGIVSGDKAQGHIGEPELSGRRLIVRTKNVESNGNKYTNIVDFEPLEEEPAPKAAPRSPAPTPAAVRTQARQAEDEALDPEEEIPF